MDLDQGPQAVSRRQEEARGVPGGPEGWQRRARGWKEDCRDQSAVDGAELACTGECLGWRAEGEAAKVVVVLGLSNQPIAKAYLTLVLFARTVSCYRLFVSLQGLSSFFFFAVCPFNK